MTPVTREEAIELLAPQPDPVGGEGDVLAEMAAVPDLYEVAALFEVRREQGIERYAVPLRRRNGRDPVADAVQEAVDGFSYAVAEPGQDVPVMERMLILRMRYAFHAALKAGVELHRLQRARRAK